MLAADLGADRGADSATKIEEAGAEAQDPKVFRPAKFWRLWLVNAASGETQDVTPEGDLGSVIPDLRRSRARA